MRVLTEDAMLACLHSGRVSIERSQSLARIDGRAVLVQPDPESRGISGCPNVSALIKPCQNTLRVQIGYSAFVSIDDMRVCLDTVKGLTDGTPPGTVDYVVRDPGQALVASGA